MRAQEIRGGKTKPKQNMTISF